MSALRNARMRFAVWTVFLVGVAFATAVSHLDAAVIVAVMFGAWILVAAVELTVSRRVTAAVAAPPPEPKPLPTVERVRVLRTQPPVPQEPHPSPPLPEPEREPAPAVAEPEPQPEPVVQVDAPRETTPEPVVAGPPARAEPEREPESEPERQPAPEPEAEPAREPPSPEPEPIGAPATPQQWNLWRLEELARRSTGDTTRDEERAYLLMFLRDFADPDGVLPTDFDTLVRESFGDLIVAGGGR